MAEHEAGVPQGKDAWDVDNWIAPLIPVDPIRKPFCQCGHRRDHHPAKACEACGCRKFVEYAGGRYK